MEQRELNFTAIQTKDLNSHYHNFQVGEDLLFNSLAYNTYMKNIDLKTIYGRLATYIKTYADTLKLNSGFIDTTRLTLLLIIADSHHGL